LNFHLDEFENIIVYAHNNNFLIKKDILPSSDSHIVSIKITNSSHYYIISRNCQQTTPWNVGNGIEELN